MRTAESIKYLATDCGSKNSQAQISKTQTQRDGNLIGEIISSPLLTVQKIDAVKNFVFLSINFLLPNEDVSGTQLRVMDKNIRAMINRELNIKRSPIECHQALWRDGDLSSPSLRDRGHILTTRSFAHVLPSDNIGYGPR
jgi:hypothetical protein